MHLALPTPTVRRKLHESAINSAMNSVKGRGVRNCSWTASVELGQVPLLLDRAQTGQALSPLV